MALVDCRCTSTLPEPIRPTSGRMPPSDTMSCRLSAAARRRAATLVQPERGAAGAAGRAGRTVDGEVGDGVRGEPLQIHTQSDTLISGVPPSSILWLAPDEGQVIQPTQDFRGKTDRELFDLVMTRNDPKSHLQNDDKILWAIGHGLAPFGKTAPGGRVPMDPGQWQNLVEAWAQADEARTEAEAARLEVDKARHSLSFLVVSGSSLTMPRFVAKTRVLGARVTEGCSQIGLIRHPH